MALRQLPRPPASLQPPSLHLKIDPRSQAHLAWTQRKTPSLPSLPPCRLATLPPFAPPSQLWLAHHSHSLPDPSHAPYTSSIPPKSTQWMEQVRPSFHPISPTLSANPTTTPVFSIPSSFRTHLLPLTLSSTTETPRFFLFRIANATPGLYPRFPAYQSLYMPWKDPLLCF